MISLAYFVVVAKHAIPLDHIGYGIFVFMPASPHRTRHAPDTRLNERLAIELVALAEEQFGFH